MEYLLLFLEGITTFISPCLLPMIPIYISFFAAGEENKRKTLGNVLGFVLGFTAVFVTLGAFAGTIGRLLHTYATAVNIVTGLIVIVLGLNFMGIIKIGFLNRTARKETTTRDLNFLSSMLFGIVFSVGWTPCVGAFLGSAMMMASSKGDTLTGILMLLVYSLGLAVPFILSAVLLDKLKGAFGFIKRNYKVINMISGGLLVVVGVLMATGLMGRFLSLLA